MNKNTANFFMRKAIVLSAIFFLVQLFSCKKDGELSPDFDSGNLTINFTDTLSIRTTVSEQDSLRTDLSVYNLLGIYNDPIFGPASSSIYTQVVLTGVNVDFGVGAVLDSVVLTLDYQALYGDTASPMSINVYELSSALDENTDYYSNTDVPYNPIPLGSLSYIPNLFDSVSLAIDTIIRKPHLRIKLNNTFGQSIINADVNGSNDLASNASFTSFMKGLYIATSDSVGNPSPLPSGTGSIVSFDMNSSLSTLTIYYNDTSSYDFTINAEGVKYSRFAHNYAGTDIMKHLINDPTKDSTVIYVSTMAGMKTKIEIPNIKELSKNGNIIINKAELVFTIENNTEGNFDDAIPSLSLVGINSLGETVFLPDFYEGLDYYGGGLVDGGSSKTYTFNISRHIQQLLYYSTIDYGMYLMANGASITANRSVISSEKNFLSKIKLNITYSKL